MLKRKPQKSGMGGLDGSHMVGAGPLKEAYPLLLHALAANSHANTGGTRSHTISPFVHPWAVVNIIFSMAKMMGKA